MDIEKHARNLGHFPKYTENDLKLACILAKVTCETWGVDTPEDHQKIMAGEIRNDHIAVQASLRTIKFIDALTDSEMESLFGTADTSLNWFEGSPHTGVELAHHGKHTYRVSPNHEGWTGWRASRFQDPDTYPDTDETIGKYRTVEEAKEAALKHATTEKQEQE